MKFWPKKRKKEIKMFHDIVPPAVIARMILAQKKASLWLKSFHLFLKTSKYGFLAVLGFIILGGLIAWAVMPEEQAKNLNIYPIKFQGDIASYSDSGEAGWRNAEKVLGKPEVPADGDLENFSDENSAVYKSGPHNLILSDFSNTEEIDDLEQYGKGEFLGAKIKFSFAMGEKKADIEIQETENKLQVEDSVAPIAATPPPEPTASAEAEPPILAPEENLPEENPPQEVLSQEIQSQDESEPISFKSRLENLFDGFLGIFSAKAQEGKPKQEGLIKDNFVLPLESFLPDKDEVISDGEPAQEEQHTPNPSQEGNSESFLPAENGDNLPNIDAKIIVWYSFDDSTLLATGGEIWWQLDTISGYSLSNALNNGYFSYNLPLLKNWDDLKNLKIKLEGVVGGETEVISYLDSVWLETEYKKLRETEREIDANSETNVKIESISSKKDFKMGEAPEFRFGYQKKKSGILASVGEAIGVVDYWDGINLTAEIITPQKETIEIPRDKFNEFFENFALEKGGEISMKLKRGKDFKPGLYRIILKIEENGEAQEFNQDFTWGVLAINVNKSIYLPNEEAYIQMAVLRDDGHTMCDASLKLEIRNPKSETIILSTEDGTIQYSGKCSGDNVTDTPDYFSYYQVGEAGIYEMTLTRIDANTGTKIHEINDSFEVRDSVPFEVERIGPTRIYPPADYEMILKIKANQDFMGEIRERVLESFIIKSQSPNLNSQTNPNDQNPSEPNVRIENCDIENSLKIDNCKLKIITWQADLKTGESYEIRYTFDAPDISPYIFLLGPLRFYE